MMPEGVKKIIRKLKNAGFEAYAVGGCVRDTLLGRPPHDWDVTTAAPAGDIQRLFPRTVPTGLKYGTVTVLTGELAVEVTTFRRDGEYKNGRRPESVRFVSSLREDLSRRDFTVNAMVMDETGAVTDLFGGREDLKGRLIRCVGDPERRFSEDALRMLRAVRLSAQHDFTVEESALAAIKRLAPLCEKLSAERVLTELRKTLEAAPARAGELIEYGLLAKYISPDAALPLERLEDVPGELRLPALAVMASAAGKSRSAPELCRALHATARDARVAAGAEQVRAGLAPSPTGEAIRLAFSDHDPAPVLAACAALGAYPQAAEELAAHAFTRPQDLAITGADAASLGLQGRSISAALRALAHAVTRGETENRRETLLMRLKEMKAAPAAPGERG